MNKEQIVIISERDLDKLIFKASRAANEQLFKGLLNYFNRLFDENEIIIDGLDYLKLFLQDGNNVEVEKSVEEFHDIKENDIPTFNLEDTEVNSRLNKILEGMSNEDKIEISQSIKHGIEQNRLRNISAVNIKLPDIKFKGDL